MKTLTSFLHGAWVHGHGSATVLHNATTEEPVATASTHGLDMAAALRWGREVGGPNLRRLTFTERGVILKKLADAIVAHRDELLLLGILNAGNTRSDAKFDVDGASATLAYYAELCKSLGDARYLVDGEPIPLGRSSRLSGQHVFVPKMGVAIHINAFNFPAWGLAEKAATAIAAGMPFIAKPATSTALLAHRMFEVMLRCGALPDGAAQLICGSVGDLFDHLGSQDVVAFTGSADTAAKLRGHKRVLAKGIAINVEADSLNVAVCGPDLESGHPTYDLFLSCVVKEVTQKAGQKCTAIRRIFVPADKLEWVVPDLVDRLSQHKVGAPNLDDVTIGPLSTAQQKADAQAGIRKLAQEAKIVLGGPDKLELHGTDPSRGYFVMPTLLVAESVDLLHAVHEHEVFAPVATVIPYTDTEQLVAMVARGEGGLVASIYSDDKTFLNDSVLGMAPYHGRICVGSEKVAGAFVPPGTVMPQLLHGGPGRAGGGTELGGTRGMTLYMQRTALQGFGPYLESLASGGKKL
jgi:oxepin-CoA hydrolase/3-oxo-5,6-dehydrosuberyl-CoA semialdehyde dehydrogenase